METAVQKKRKPLSTWLLLASLYMTQYLGLVFFWIALVTIMRQQTRFAVTTGTAAAQILGLFALAWLLTGPCTTLRAYGAAGLYFLSREALFALMNTLMMDLAPLKSPATDFTLQYSVSSFAMLLAAISGAALAGRTSYLAVMSGACIIACVAMAVSIYVAPPESRKNFSTARKEGI